jgi:N-acetylglucosaminyl-diphospho-decaprenol L-rhamnosyltransferase
VSEGVTLSLVLVTHRSEGVLRRCVESFRREATAVGATAEVVVVDQSEDQVAVEAVRGSGADLALLRPNRGYASGLNAGVRLAHGSVLILANPDVELLPGSLTALLDALRSGADVAGPQLVWDAAGRLLLPPPEDPAPAREAWRLARRRWQPAWRLGLEAALERNARLWSAAEPERGPCLRGPLLALERRGWERLGPLDEGYFLYFEETEWLWRAHRRGARLALVRDARVVHRFGHAAQTRPDRAAVEARSRRRFADRNYPAPWRALVRWLERTTLDAGVDPVAVAGPDRVPVLEADLWLLSPHRDLQPAAGWLGAAPPAELETLTRAGHWFLAAASRAGSRWRIKGCFAWGTA